MNSIKSIATLASAVLLGVLVGVAISRPPTVKAKVWSPYIHLQKLKEGMNVRSSPNDETVLGFSCTQEECYIATE